MLTYDELENLSSKLRSDTSGRMYSEHSFNQLMNKSWNKADEIKRDVDFIAKDRKMAIDSAIKKNAEAINESDKKSVDLLDDVVIALSKLCGNHQYNALSKEDEINDYVRDVINTDLTIKDQTRQGDSGTNNTNNRQAGELDFQIVVNKKIVGIYEGLKINSIQKDLIYDHISKAIINYNPQGVLNVFVVAYVVKHQSNFKAFWDKLTGCLNKYTPPVQGYEINWKKEEIETDLSAIKGIEGTYNMDGIDHCIYFLAVKIKD